MNLKAISTPTWEKLHKLRGGGGFWQRVLAGLDEKVEMLEELAACGEPAVIPEIADYLLAFEGEIRRATRKAVDQLLSQVPRGRLAEMDYRVREVGSHRPHWETAWWQMKPDELERIASEDHGVSILGLASFHANGHVREAALRKLAEHRSGSELPFLLIRLNDWVQPVQTQARGAIQSRLTTDYASHFLTNLQLVLRLEFCGRGEHTALVKDISTLLRRPECRHHLLEGASSGDRAMRRACLRLAAEIEGAGRLSVLRAALTDSDPLIRFWTARRLLPDASLDELPRLATELARDPFMPVRREALQALAQRLPENARPSLMDALTDRHTSIRETARFFLSELGDFDAASVYRDRLNAAVGAQLVGAIRGLGETGTAKDAERIRPLLNAGEARHRKAAIFALARIAAENFTEEFTAALADTQPGVSNEACKALLQRARRVEVDTLFYLLREDKREYVKKNAMKLIVRLDKWVSLPALISVSCGDSAIASRTRELLNAWLHSSTRGYARPTNQQLTAAEHAFAKASSSLDSALHRELSSLLKELRTK